MGQEVSAGLHATAPPSIPASSVASTNAFSRRDREPQHRLCHRALAVRLFPAGTGARCSPDPPTLRFRDGEPRPGAAASSSLSRFLRRVGEHRPGPLWVAH